MGNLTAPLLGELLPMLAAELDASLRSLCEVELADQIQHLPITKLCDCGDESCGSFFTGQRAQTLWRTGRRCLTPRLMEGLAYLEVLDGVIVFVGMLERPADAEVLRGRLTR